MTEEADKPPSRQAVSGGGDLWGGWDVRSGAGRALARFVTDSSQLSERSALPGAQRVLRCRPQAEHPSEVTAKAVTAPV
jgi:hypothetical protein